MSEVVCRVFVNSTNHLMKEVVVGHVGPFKKTEIRPVISHAPVVLPPLAPKKPESPLTGAVNRLGTFLAKPKDAPGLQSFKPEFVWCLRGTRDDHELAALASSMRLLMKNERAVNSMMDDKAGLLEALGPFIPAGVNKDAVVEKVSAAVKAAAKEPKFFLDEHQQPLVYFKSMFSGLQSDRTWPYPSSPNTVIERIQRVAQGILAKDLTPKTAAADYWNM